MIQNANDTMPLQFLGGANSTNVIQATVSLTAPVPWQNVSTNVADASGAWQFTDTNKTATRFYRSQCRLRFEPGEEGGMNLTELRHGD